jgi:hypothetical protein
MEAAEIPKDIKVARLIVVINLAFVRDKQIYTFPWLMQH